MSNTYGTLDWKQERAKDAQTSCHWLRSEMASHCEASAINNPEGCSLTRYG
jgi:hypothetical protein